jgi:hypothetical protein
MPIPIGIRQNDADLTGSGSTKLKAIIPGYNRQRQRDTPPRSQTAGTRQLAKQERKMYGIRTKIIEKHLLWAELR